MGGSGTTSSQREKTTSQMRSQSRTLTGWWWERLQKQETQKINLCTKLMPSLWSLLAVKDIQLGITYNHLWNCMFKYFRERMEAGWLRKRKKNL